MTKWSRVFFWVFGSPWHFINKARLMCLQMDNKDFCMDWTRVCCYSVAKLCLTLQFHGLQHARFPLSFTISQSLIKFTSIELVMSWNHLIFWCNLFFLPSIIPSIRVFSNESTLHISWSKYWSFSFSISPSKNIQGWCPLGLTDLLGCPLAVQGTLKSLLQHHSSKASILQHSAFFMVQLSHPYMSTGKTIALTRWTFVSKLMSLLFNMLLSMDRGAW